jgi:hypothetical protein
LAEACGSLFPDDTVKPGGLFPSFWGDMMLVVFSVLALDIPKE